MSSRTVIYKINLVSTWTNQFELIQRAIISIPGDSSHVREEQGQRQPGQPPSRVHCIHEGVQSPTGQIPNRVYNLLMPYTKFRTRHSKFRTPRSNFSTSYSFHASEQPILISEYPVLISECPILAPISLKNRFIRTPHSNFRMPHSTTHLGPQSSHR